MKYRWIIFCVFVIGTAFITYSRIGETHRFSDDECALCHIDVKNNPEEKKPVLSSVCSNCHADRGQSLSHPYDIPPETDVPADMPLVDGKLTCITCHFVHPVSVRHKAYTRYRLRRPGRGAIFCSACHRIDEKGHMYFENIHQGSYRKTNTFGALDEYTLQCIECHDRHITDPSERMGSGKWKHFSSKLNHPVGIPFTKIASGKPRKFNSPNLLPGEIRLYNGKIGCGTCHNVFSKEKRMLVLSNYKSRLCLECHKK